MTFSSLTLTLRLFTNMTDVTLAGTDVSTYGLCCKDGRDHLAEWLKGVD
jgi:hypothetical protein